MKRLVLDADDLGLAPALTRRVVALLSEGLVTDVSLLSVGESFDEAVRALSVAGVRDAGVHLCLVGGERPIAPAERVPSLLHAGRFRKNWVRVAAAIAMGRIRIAEVEREWEEQIVRVARAGLAVTHLDSHQHLHLHPALFPVAIRLARRFGVPFVRAPREDDHVAAAPALSRFRARLLALLGGRARRLLSRAGLADPPRVLGLAETGHMTTPRWQALLGSLPDGDSEIVIHPGEEDDATRTRYRHWGFEWQEEAEALESGAVREALAGRGFVACSFADLAIR